MSYNVAIVLPPVSESDEQAWKELDAQIDQEGTRAPIFDKLHALLTKKYPCICDLPDDKVDNGVWSDGPLINNFGHRAAILGMTFSSVKKTLPFLIKTSTTLNLTVFDWATHQIHRPAGLKELKLTLEGQAELLGPTLSQILAAVDTLNTKTGPGFFVVEGPGEDYVQVAGGKGAYTLEWRNYKGKGFLHTVAGLLKKPAKKDIAIKTHGFEVTVKENEKLNVEQIKEILSAYAHRAARPPAFSWRDVTERFK